MINMGEARGTYSEERKTRHHTIRTVIRTIIVGFTWLIVAIKPDTPNAFYEPAWVASLTSLYEYCIMWIDVDPDDKMRRALFKIGVFISGVYFVGVVFCAFRWINLNVNSMEFSFGSQMPFPNATDITWSYYWTVVPMMGFPALVMVEPWLKRSNKQEKQQSDVEPAATEGA